MAKVFKLDGRKVVVSENGTSKVLTPPSGVSYSEVTERWQTWIINDETNGWRSKSFGIHAHGAISAFELAVEAREESLTFILNRRLLPRIRRTYDIRVINGLYVVRDPLEKNYRKFANEEAAKAFNKSITLEWIATYTFNKHDLIKRYNPNQSRGISQRVFNQLGSAAQ